MRSTCPNTEISYSTYTCTLDSNTDDTFAAHHEPQFELCKNIEVQSLIQHHAVKDDERNDGTSVFDDLINPTNENEQNIKNSECICHVINYVNNDVNKCEQLTLNLDNVQCKYDPAVESEFGSYSKFPDCDVYKLDGTQAENYADCKYSELPDCAVKNCIQSGNLDSDCRDRCCSYGNSGVNEVNVSYADGDGNGSYAASP